MLFGALSLSKRLPPRLASAAGFKPGRAGPPHVLLAVLLPAFSPQFLSRDEPGNTWRVKANHFLLNSYTRTTLACSPLFQPACLVSRTWRDFSCSFSVFEPWEVYSTLVVLLLSWVKRKTCVQRVWIQQEKETWFQHLWCGAESLQRGAPGHLKNQPYEASSIRKEAKSRRSAHTDPPGCLCWPLQQSSSL